MTAKLFTVVGFSALFSLSAIAAESAEPIPTVETAGLDFEQDAARKKKKKKQTRSNNGQSQNGQSQNAQQRKQAKERAKRAERKADQAESHAERAEDRADRAQRESNQAQRRANQAQRPSGSHGGSAHGASSAQRRAQAERRDEAARRAARHRNADRNAQRNQQSGYSNSYRSGQASRPHHGNAHRGGHANTRSHRWHSGWSQGHHRPVHWYHGVFVYGPNPYRHNRVRRGVYTDNSPVPMPSRKIDRDGAFSVGLTTGSYASGYDLGGNFSDFGLGVTTRFRPVEGLGFELAYSVHDDTFDGETQRTTTMLAPSVQVFVAPWSRISPYASVGVTFSERAYNDVWTDGFEQYTTQINDSSFGPHVGIGLEFALGQNAAINFEARAIGYLDNQEGGTIPGAVQSTFGAQWYF